MAEIFKLKNITQNIDITPYVINYEWSGDLQTAGRKLNFVIAYTTKDKGWCNVQIALGDRVELSCIDNSSKMYKIFQGVVFMQSRNSESYTMEFVAYDNLIYLAKSKMTAKFSQCSIADCITQVCNTLGVTVSSLCEDLNYKVDFIADNMSGTEIIKKALAVATAWTGWTYHIYMDAEQKINVVRADTTIENYKISDTYNLMTASHSASIEDMVNQIAITDKDGNITGYIKNDDDIQKYGMLQGIYKIDNKQNTEQTVKLLLHKVTENSSITALGNIQCIAGYAVEIQEEQIKGTFLISSDSHKIESNVHTMELKLAYIITPSDVSSSYESGV